MKKSAVFLLSAVLGAALCAANATTFREIRGNAFKKRSVSDCKSCEIVYSIRTGKGETGSLVFRQKTPNFNRIDILGMDETISAGFDGKNFWGCRDQQNSTLTDEEIAEYIYDVAFLAIPVEDVNVFSPLAADGTENVSGVDCDIYRTALLEDSSCEIKLAVAKEDGLLRRVEMTTPDDKYITTFDDYTDKDGVMVAQSICCVGVEGTITLTLRKAQWDTNADDALFSPAGKPTVEVAAAPAVTERKLDAEADRRAAQLRADIKVLEEQIASEEKKMADLEAVYSNNQKQENALSTPPVNGFYRTTHRYRRLYRRTMHYHNRAMKKLMREDRKLAREHGAINDSILKLRTQLTKKQQELDTITNK